ncbi:hypothetical protein N5J23_05690 [Comamonas aquatica]|uniref:HTH cro/C1-type domain-containing protein n=1 Tax=Comamonas aquatica TaxID=225991 RepID=A0AA43AU40_9BURK|nr:sigma factor-like helix-turn-helix DNA-binding protein [Comamonas aquatica]MDH1427344.1 hypothetical protein [Comamonas aquatica]MDH1605030.1 hypothetical protein [Comamonas aquatica]MDH1617146.1 hypothetical protein [Comamonas aquatica]MDH2005038.1 hypothetical protein [Comamonas aquatica]
MNESKSIESHSLKPEVSVAKEDKQRSPQADIACSSKATTLTESRCYGLSAGAGVSATLVAYSAVVDLCATGAVFGLTVGKQNNIEIFTADHVSASDLKLQVSRLADSEKIISVVAPKTPNPPDYRSQEGRALLSPPKAGGCRIVIVPASNKKARWSEADLNAFKRAVVGKSSRTVVIFQGLNNEEETYLTSYFNGVLGLCGCEPDEGYASAHMASALPGSFLAVTGHQPVIENIRVDTEGHIERQCLPCVSPYRLDREIYRLRKEEDKSLEEIGEVLGFNKSTISRRLSALPFQLRGDRL